MGITSQPIVAAHCTRMKGCHKIILNVFDIIEAFKTRDSTRNDFVIEYKFVV